MADEPAPTIKTVWPAKTSGTRYWLLCRTFPPKTSSPGTAGISGISFFLQSSVCHAGKENWPMTVCADSLINRPVTERSRRRKFPPLWFDSPGLPQPLSTRPIVTRGSIKVTWWRNCTKIKQSWKSIMLTCLMKSAFIASWNEEDLWSHSRSGQFLYRQKRPFQCHTHRRKTIIHSRFNSFSFYFFDRDRRGHSWTNFGYFSTNTHTFWLHFCISTKYLPLPGVVCRKISKLYSIRAQNVSM